ncbi:MAG: exosortase system-associated protein, TIGR04073 family [Chthoniobacteraceae bacterium]
MKRLLLSLTISLFAANAMADIQDPPMRNYDATRKLGRGWANFIYGPAEIADTMQRVNELDGNAAAWTYGWAKGVRRWIVRASAGVYEIFTYPFPTNRRSYRPVLRSNIPWINGGYEEFPPEFGFQSRKNYTTGYWRY